MYWKSVQPLNFTKIQVLLDNFDKYVSSKRDITAAEGISIILWELITSMLIILVIRNFCECIKVTLVKIPTAVYESIRYFVCHPLDSSFSLIGNVFWLLFKGMVFIVDLPGNVKQFKRNFYALKVKIKAIVFLIFLYLILTVAMLISVNSWIHSERIH